MSSKRKSIGPPWFTVSCNTTGGDGKKEERELSTGVVGRDG
jgi:hypothetical protein